MTGKVFYSDGLQFECQRCSACCRHDPGYVFLTRKDLLMLAAGKRVSEKVFLERFCRIVEIGGFTRVSLIEKDNFDCIFWKEKEGCIVYENRPVQCRTYPFWISFLEDEVDWKNEASNCPGIGKGRIVSRQEIEERIAERQEESMLTV